MVMQCWHTFGSARFIGKTILSTLMICCLTDVACSDPNALQRSSGDRGEYFNARLGRLDRIPPGAIIDEKAPPGWSHLIMKSYSVPGAGDVKQLSPTADRLTRLLFTAIVADVHSQPERTNTEDSDGNRYKLAKVAIGLGTHIGDKDIVITPDTQKQLGADLGLIARIVLRTAQEKLGAMSVVASSPTLMVFDSPSLMLVDGAHKPIILRYAVLVEGRSGKLDALAWTLERENEVGVVIGAIQWLPENLTDECVLHVDGSAFRLGQPTEKAFAILAPPKGQKKIEPTGALKLLAARPHFSPATTADLEARLREAMMKE